MAIEEKVDTETTEKDSEGAEAEEAEGAESEEETSTEEKSEIVVESPEAKRSRLERQLKQHNKKYGFEAEVKPKSKVESKKSDETDYAQEAYLIAQGIKEADERELVRERMANTGKSLKETVENKYTQQDLEELRSAKAVKIATPSGSKRSGASASDTVDYWRAKIDAGKATLLDIPDVKLRRQIVNSRLAKEKDVDHFTDNPFGTIDITK